MRRALALAARGRETVSPNPMVGAVLVRGGAVVGTGFHRRPGERHAEVAAIRRAGRRARGATLYVNLEPCCHHGRTPPCVDAILDAGIRRVVAGITDPDPRVRGKGLGALRRAGVRVDLGLLRDEARRLNEAYLHFIRSGRPFVVMKAGMSLDGRIATRQGHSRWITSSRSRAAGGEARWARDGILVGLGTVRADDPLLTARRGGRIKPGFVRVVLDSQLRIPLRSRLVRSARRSPLRVYALRAAPAARERRLRAAGVEVIRVRARGGRVDPRSVLDDLGANEITSILLEGGGEVNASFLEADLVDKFLLFVAPTFLGGRNAIPVVGGVGAALPSEAFRLAHWESHRLGPDLLIEGYPSRRK